VIALDPDGTLDNTLGVVFGRVLDQAGAPVAGATVTVTPAGGSIFYFDATGAPAVSATSTGPNGWFLVLNAPPSNPVRIDAWSGATPIGTVYGRIVANTVAGLSPRPAVAVQGSAVDEAGNAVGGASIVWDFDPGIGASADGAGAFSLSGLAGELDVTLRGVAGGHRPALTFRRAAAQIGNLAEHEMRFLSDASYVSWQGGFGVVQAPSLGMIFGRVLGRDAAPLAGATVTVDPVVGAVRYFDASGEPEAGRAQTSSSGSFVVFNVPVGFVAVSAVGPGEVLRAEIAPSEAGVVTAGDLKGLALFNVAGRVKDEQSASGTVAGAVVSVQEYPYLATIADAAGFYRLEGVPAGEYLSFKVSRSDFKDSYSFLEKTPTTDKPCQCLATNSSCSSGSQCCSGICSDASGAGKCQASVAGDEQSPANDCKNLFTVSTLGFFDIHSQGGVAANRARGLVISGVLLSNGIGALGLTAALNPASSAPRYIRDQKYGKTFLSTFGGVEFLNAKPSVGAVVFSDPRNDIAELRLVRILENSVSLSPSSKLACDAGGDGTFSNVYPCDGVSFSSSAKDAFFQWGMASNVKFQVQFSTDPSFATIATTSAKLTGVQWITKQYFYLGSSGWNKIKKLGPAGGAIYWRMLGRDKDKHETTTAPYMFHLP